MATAGLPEQTVPDGALYVVGVPIGNLGDITLRALWVLSRVDAVAAEDTRETRKLLDRFGLSPQLLSVREHNERMGAEQIVARLSRGEKVALVTDAGTPAVSDPGARVVDAVYEAGLRVIPIPGASAVVTALSAAGLLGSGFHFVGFVPPQAKARRAALAELAEHKAPFVLYEAPHRVVDLLKDLGAALKPERRVVVSRELTKRFETITRLTAGELCAWAQEHEPQEKYVILIDEIRTAAAGVNEEARKWLRALSSELPASRLSAVGAKATGLPRQAIYDFLLDGKREEQ